MILTWRDRRKYMYLGVVGALALVALVYGYSTFLYSVPTCADGKQNNDERGVDCGGTMCSLICPADSRAPTVLWARAFQTGTNTFTAAAYLQNNMVGNGARAVQYSFQLFDDQNKLIIERQGVTDLPPNQTIPIVEPNIDVGNKLVAHTQFTFSRNPVWGHIPDGRVVPLRVSGQELAADGTRLSATVENTTVVGVPRTTVVAVLFDTEGVARAASKSVVQGLAGRSSQGVIFTWPTPMPNIARAEITLVPAF